MNTANTRRLLADTKKQERMKRRTAIALHRMHCPECQGGGHTGMVSFPLEGMPDGLAEMLGRVLGGDMPGDDTPPKAH